MPTTSRAASLAASFAASFAAPLAAGLAAAALLAGPAPAQGTGAQGASAQGASAFVTEQPAGQWRASKLVGVDVYGPDNAKIGDVGDVLLDASGSARIVVIGVGGFLGIGQKNVALPFDAVEWSSSPARSAADGTARDLSASGTTAAPAGAAPGSAPGAAPGAAQGAAPGPSTTAAADALARGYPDHAVVKLTKADLERAPNFRYAGARADAAPQANGLSSPIGGGAPTNPAANPTPVANPPRP